MRLMISLQFVTAKSLQRWHSHFYDLITPKKVQEAVGPIIHNSLIPKSKHLRKCEILSM